jgi:uncharacterized protein YkwD
MTVDGQPVMARYDPNFRAVLYTPDAPMTPGAHAVHCEVCFNETSRFIKDWQTKIASSPIADYPEPNSAQTVALHHFNQIRSALNLPPFSADRRFEAAAQDHSDYMAKNQVFGHGEEPGKPDFCGAEAHARLEQHGWGGPYWEGITFGSTDPDDAIQEMYDAPYHRLPFLQPGNGFFGFGVAHGRYTAEFSRASVPATVTSPADREIDVPTQWIPHEHPDPLQFHPELQNKGPLGYPIMLAQFNGGTGRLRIYVAELRDDQGNIVPSVMNYSGDDPNLQDAMIIIPTAPLEKGRGYRVVVQGYRTDGKRLDCRWEFRTQQ